MEQQTPIPPKSRMKPREGQICAIFPSLIWRGRGGGTRFSIYFVQDCNLGQNKMEQQTPIPPKSRMKPHEGQKRSIFPSLIWRGRGGGGLGFPFILSKSVGDWWRVRIRGSQQHISTQTFLKYLPWFGSFLFPHSQDPPLFFFYYEDQDQGISDKWTPYYGIKQPVIKVPKFIVEKNNIIL